MKKTILLIIIVMFVSGCSMFGYEDKYERDRSLCERCAESCGDFGHLTSEGVWEWMQNCTNTCFEKFNNGITPDNCSEECVDKWNNRSDIKEYQKCFNERCWICG